MKRKNNFHKNHFSQRIKEFKKMMYARGSYFNNPHVYFKQGNWIKKYFPKDHDFLYTFIAEGNNKHEDYGYFTVFAIDRKTFKTYKMYAEINKDFKYISDFKVIIEPRKNKK